MSEARRQWFAGIDWASSKHDVSVSDNNGKIIGRRTVEHSGLGLAEMADWLVEKTGALPADIHVAIDTPHGAVVETLLDPAHAALRAASARALESALRGLAERSGAILRGRGHLWALVLREAQAALVRDAAFEAGLLLNAARPHVLRLMPALDVGAAQIAEMSAILGPLL